MALLKSLKHKVQIASQLTLLDWLTLLEAWWLLLAFYLSVRWMSYERVSQIAHPTHGEIIFTSSQLDMAQHLARVVALSSRLHFLPMTCLVKALTLRWLLGRQGIQSCLCIGANKSLDRVHAHAWVEVHGQAIGESGNIVKNFQLLASGRRPVL